MLDVIGLLVAFEVKKFFCSYVFQTPYMLRRVRSEQWIKPSLAYALVHAMGTLAIVVGFSSFNSGLDLAPWAALYDFVRQFSVDRYFLSNQFLQLFSPSTLNNFSNGDTAAVNWRYWRIIGAKNGIHHLITYLLIYLLVTFGS